MTRVVAYDLVRLFLGPIFPAPRGIDRVELALARQIFADEKRPNLGILPTPWGAHAFPAEVVRRWLGNLQRLWAEEIDGLADPQLLRLIAQIRCSQDTVTPATPLPRAFSTSLKARRILGSIRAAGFPLGRLASQAVPKGAVYLNVGQLGLAVPFFHNWLGRRRDITCAIMLHDVIPLKYPELVNPGSVAHHARMVRTAAHRADCMIYTSGYACDGVSAALAGLGRERLPSLVRSLPLPAAFADASGSLPELAGAHYFVAIATIEPRKNIELLMRVWQGLLARKGEAKPHLIIVGSHGYGAGRILAALNSDPVLRTRIHQVSGLSSPALAALVLGAAGMLCPSHSEGFGLPVLEGNAMGLPTIASDIPAHRELADASTTLLPADDELAWERAIVALDPPGHRLRPPVPHSLTEAAYYADLMAFLEDSASSRG